MNSGEGMNGTDKETEIKNEIIEGRNAVIEALRVGRSIDKIFINKGDVDKTLGHIASKAREAGIVVVEAVADDVVLHLQSGGVNVADNVEFVGLQRGFKGARNVLEHAVAVALPDVEDLAVARVNEQVNVCPQVFQYRLREKLHRSN